MEIRVTKQDTYDWANRPGQIWPRSTMSGKSFEIKLDSEGNLISISSITHTFDPQELSCFLTDLKKKYNIG